MGKSYFLKEFDTTTSRYSNVEISNKKLYDQCRRSKWRIENDDENSIKHTIPISGLIGGDEGTYENFHEFISYDSEPGNVLIMRENHLFLCRAILSLDESERSIIIFFYYNGFTEAQIALKMGVNQSTISRKKKAAEEKLKIFLEKAGFDA